MVHADLRRMATALHSKSEVTQSVIQYRDWVLWMMELLDSVQVVFRLTDYEVVAIMEGN
jgi:hypothetical protein